MPNLSIKDVPEEWAEILRRQAARHHRSLQGELMFLVEQAVRASLDEGRGCSPCPQEVASLPTNGVAASEGMLQYPHGYERQGTPAHAGTVTHQGVGTLDQWLAERRASGVRTVAEQSSSRRIIRNSRDHRA